MPRKRFRLTRTKKKSQKATGGDPDAPSAKEWEVMPQYGSFIVRGDDEDGHTFGRYDTALILPNQYDPKADIAAPDYWVGRIADIRARPQTGDVWAKVQWYYSGNDVAGLIKSYKSDMFGELERLKSDHFDFVSSLCFSQTTNVPKYDEVSLDQDQIDPEDFFCRYTFEHRARIVDPKPFGSCFCHQSYNPSTDTMHFCPRPSCRKAYHRDCLIAAHSMESATKEDRNLRLIATSPDQDEVFTLCDLVPAPDPKRRGRQSGVPRKNPGEILASLPSDLVGVAQQQIVRGVHGGGLVGNVKSVIAARRMVYEAVRGQIVKEDWKEILASATPKTGTKVVAKKSKGDTEWGMLICPGCKGPV